MTWRDDVDRKREFGIWRGRGNPESKRKGIGNRSAFGVAFWDWDVVAKRFWGAFSGRGLRGVSSDCESVAERFWEAFLGMGLRRVSSDCELVKRTLMDRELGGTVLEPCWISRCWDLR
jgi:hypothetical protein